MGRCGSFLLLLAALGAAAPAAAADSGALVSALLGDTPLEDDLLYLTQVIGGRETGTEANLRAVAWTEERLAEAGVSARREAFTMPDLWLENAAAARIVGEGVAFDAAIAAMPFSAPTPPEGLSAPLLDAGRGTAADFERLGERARGAWLLVSTELLTDIDGLFREYAEAYEVEQRAAAAGVAGVITMSSRAPGLLYRHNASLRGDDALPLVVLERDAALRARDLLRAGTPLEARVTLDLSEGGPFESYNVIGEIPGGERPEEVVVVGAHLDSWDFGTGTLDNGANVVLLMDIARQMVRLGIEPSRTIRFGLWNGEEQGFYGSQGYVERHGDALDRHAVAMSFDIGCGRINGFFTGARPEVADFTRQALTPVAGLGPFTMIDAPVVGTDNYDFMMHGVANLVGNHEAASYGPNYHASSDQLNECDLQTLRINAAIVATVTLAYANDAPLFPRQSRAQIEAMIDATGMEADMRNFGVWQDWLEGRRGRRP